MNCAWCETPGARLPDPTFGNIYYCNEQCEQAWDDYQFSPEAERIRAENDEIEYGWRWRKDKT